MTISYCVQFETSDQDQILTQLRGYKERELDRSPPTGFEAVSILRGTDDKTVIFQTQWADEETLEETRTSAPWEACIDLCSVFADDHKDAVFALDA